MTTYFVIARLDRAIQYSETPVMESKSRGVLDTPLSRSMTVFVRRKRSATHPPN